MLLLSLSHSPHNPAAALPTHTHTHQACMHVQIHKLQLAHLHKHTHADCVEVVHACLVELSYVERIFDLSQPASPICMHSPGSVGFLAPHQLQMQVTEVARGRFPHIPVCESVCANVICVDATGLCCCRLRI